MFIVQRYVPDVAPAGEPNARFDFGGVLTMAVSLIAYAASLTLAQESSLLSPLPAALMALAIASAIAFVTIERSIEHPAVDLSIFRDKLFSLNMIMGLMVFVVLASNIVLLPFYLEKVQLYSTIKSGFMLAAVPITMAVIAPVSGMLSDRFGPRLISALGIALMTIGYFAASTLEAGISEAHYFAKIMPIGIGFGMFQTPNNAAIMAVAPRDRLGVVSGLLSLTRTVGMASGIPLIGMLFAGYVLSTTGISGEDFMNVEPAVMLGGIRRAFLVCAIIATAATLVAFFALARAPSTRPKREELTA
jgi:MFS family permease